MTNSNKDPCCVLNNNLGFAIGVNGTKVNRVEANNLTYSDKLYLHKWMATQSTENFVLLRPGDRVSMLLWANNVKYMNVPTNPTIVIPNLDPPAGSIITLTGKITCVIEDP